MGTYLGVKKYSILDLDFLITPTDRLFQENNQLKGQDVNIVAFDAFYDAPVGGNNAAITAYASHSIVIMEKTIC